MDVAGRAVRPVAMPLALIGLIVTARAFGRRNAPQETVRPIALVLVLAAPIAFALTVKGLGFGLGVDVVLENAASGRRVSNGAFAWGGAFGTYFWVDRKEALVGVLMVQEPVNSLRTDFQNAVTQAIID